MRNSTRAWILLSAISLALIVTGNIIGGREGLLWGFALALTINTLCYFYLDLRLPIILKAKIVEGQDPWLLLQNVNMLAKKAKLACPEVYIYKSSTPNVLACGRSWKHGKIFISSGALQQLKPDEVVALLAYQVASIKSFDVVAQSILATLSKGILFIPQQLDRFLALAIGPHWEFQKQGQITTWLAAPLVALLVKLCITNESTLSTDLLASNLCDSKNSLAQSLWKLESYRKTKPENIPAHLNHLYMVNPLTGQSWTKYFNLQPAIKNRIENLIGYYPI